MCTFSLFHPVSLSLYRARVLHRHFALKSKSCGVYVRSLRKLNLQIQFNLRIVYSAEKKEERERESGREKESIEDVGAQRVCGCISNKKLSAALLHQYQFWLAITRLYAAMH